MVYRPTTEERIANALDEISSSFEALNVTVERMGEEFLKLGCTMLELQAAALKAKVPETPQMLTAQEKLQKELLRQRTLLKERQGG